MPCPHCADGFDRERADRACILQLLALIEHSAALPRDAALRIAGELLARLACEAPARRCDPVGPDMAGKAA